MSAVKANNNFSLPGDSDENNSNDDLLFTNQGDTKKAAPTGGAQQQEDTGAGQKFLIVDGNDNTDTE